MHIHVQDRKAIGCKAAYTTRLNHPKPIPKNIKRETILHCANPLFQVKEKTKQKTPKYAVLRQS